MEGANSFLAELPLFGKGLQNQGSEVMFPTERTCDHGRVNSNLLDWATDAWFVPLAMISYGYVLIALVSVSTLYVIGP